MKKKGFTLIELLGVMAGLVLLNISPLFASEVILRENFENGASSFKVGNSEIFSAVIVSQEKYEGDCALEVSSKEGAKPGWELLCYKEKIDLQPGKAYRLSANFKGKGIKAITQSTAALVFSLFYNGASQERYVSLSIKEGDFPWERHSEEFSVPPGAENAYLQPCAAANMEGTFWVDNIELQATGSSENKEISIEDFEDEGALSGWNFSSTYWGEKEKKGMPYPEAKVKLSIVDDSVKEGKKSLYISYRIPESHPASSYLEVQKNYIPSPSKKHRILSFWICPKEHTVPFVNIMIVSTKVWKDAYCKKPLDFKGWKKISLRPEDFSPMPEEELWTAIDRLNFIFGEGGNYEGYIDGIKWEKEESAGEDKTSETKSSDFLFTFLPDKEEGIVLTEVEKGRLKKRAIGGRECINNEFGEKMKDTDIFFDLKGPVAVSPSEKLVVAIDYFDFGDKALYVTIGDKNFTIPKQNGRIWKRKVLEASGLSLDGPGGGHDISFSSLQGGQGGIWQYDLIYVSALYGRILKGNEAEEWEALSPRLENASYAYGKSRVDFCYLEDGYRQLSCLTKNPGIYDALLNLEKDINKIRSLYGELYREGKNNYFLNHKEKTEEAIKEVETISKNITGNTDYLKAEIDKALEKEYVSLKDKYPWLEKETIILDKPDTEKIGKSIRVGVEHYQSPPPLSFSPLKLDYIGSTYGGESPFPPYSSKPDGTFDFSYFSRFCQDVVKQGYQVGCAPLEGCFAMMYLPEWFKDKYGEEVLQKSRSGYTNTLAGNIWHPEVLKFFDNFASVLGKEIKDNKNISHYEIWNEGNLGVPAAGSVNATFSAGYSKSAITSFRDYLKNKYKTIEDLNKALVTSYREWEEILPPEARSEIKSLEFEPLVAEFEWFKDDSWIDFFHRYCGNLQKADPNHPVLPEAINSIQQFKMAKGWDIHSFHSGGGISGPSHDFCRYYPINYSINYFQNPARPLWVDEYWWASDEGFSIKDEKVIEAVLKRGLWQATSWGVTGFTFFLLALNVDNYNCNMLDDNLGFTIIRPAIGALPMVKDKLNNYISLFNETKILADIAILMPETSNLLGYPEGRAEKELASLHNFLFRKHYTCLFVPEDGLITGEISLNDFKVIILPYSVYLNKDAGRKILDWTKNGGLLILSGPAGVYDESGKRNNNFLGELFDLPLFYGKDKIKSFSPVKFNEDKIDIAPDGNSFWYVKDWEKYKGLVSGYYSDKSPAILEREYEKGKVIFTLLPASNYLPLKTYLLDAILKRIGPPDVASNEETTQLMVREDKNKNRYLIAVNLDPLRPAYLEPILRGDYRHLIDLTIYKGIPVASSQEKGFTVFPLSLGPGEGRVIQLGKQESRIYREENLNYRVLLLKEFLGQAKMQGTDTGQREKEVKAIEDKVAGGEITEAELIKTISGIKEAVSRKQTDTFSEDYARRLQEALKKIEGTSYDNVEKERLFSFGRMIEELIKEKCLDKTGYYLGCLEKFTANISALNYRQVDKDRTAEVPKITTPISFDGYLKEKEWVNSAMIKVPPANTAIGSNTGEEDISPVIHLLWDENNLYAGAEVKDNSFYPNFTEGQIWLSDCLEIFLNVLDDEGLPIEAGPGIGLSASGYGPDDFQILFGTGGEILAGENILAKGLKDKCKTMVQKTEKGYSMEVIIPWSSLFLRPVKDYTIGFDIAVDDKDASGKHCQIVWSGTATNFFNTKGWGRLKLIE